MSTAPPVTGPAADPRLRWVLGALIVAALVVTTLGNFTRVPSTDPQFNRDVVERTEKYGGTFYENGIVNKGPLEPLVHWIALRVASYNGYWFVMSAFAALVSLFLAFAAARTARHAGAPPFLAAVAGVATFIHFSYSGSYYSGSLHVRNLTIALLCGAWLLMLGDRNWNTPKRRVGATIAVFALIALAVQTLLPTVLSATVIGVATFALLRDRTAPGERLGLAGYAFITTDVVLVGAPVWYALRGTFDEFWTGWFVHGRLIATGRGLGLAAQLDGAWDNFYAYHQQNPVVTVVVGTFLVLAWTGRHKWPRPRRISFLALTAWWITAWVELAITQRFGLHYYVSVTMPVVLMAALLCGLGYQTFLGGRRQPTHAVWWPVGAVLLSAFLAGPGLLATAVRQTADFRGFDAAVAALDRNKAARLQTARAVLGLATAEGDALLAWTNDAWAYQELKRASATRFIWKSLLVGEIYQGTAGPQNVLPRTWEWFAADLAESEPQAVAEIGATIDPETPFADYVGGRFTPVYTGDAITIWLRNELAAQLRSPGSGQPWQPTTEPPAGWSVSGDAVRFAEAGGERPPLALAVSCSVVTGRIEWSAAEDAILSIIFRDPAADRGAAEIMVDRTAVSTWSDDAAYEPRDLSDGGAGAKEFILIVGARSAGLIVNGDLVAAALLPPQVVVTIHPRTASLGLTGLRVHTAPAAAGCPG